MIVVADTSPINYLVLIEHTEILPHFYGRNLIPSSVGDELRDVNTRIEYAHGSQVRPHGLKFTPRPSPPMRPSTSSIVANETPLP